MKKAFIFLLVLCMLFSLAGCGELTPIEKCQQRAVSIGERFLNYEITGKEARELLNDLKAPETEGNGQLYLDVDIGYLAFIIAKQDSTYAEIEKQVEDIRNSTYE